jgi:hypothetical protein
MKWRLSTSQSVLLVLISLALVELTLQGLFRQPKQFGLLFFLLIFPGVQILGELIPQALDHPRLLMVTQLGVYLALYCIDVRGRRSILWTALAIHLVIASVLITKHWRYVQ